jgi:hypothetical protein
MASNDPLHKIVKGYPKLAARMEIQPELAIYRRFGALNAQNLLYLQAELETLEKNLRKQQIQDDNDKQGNGPRYAKDWYWLNESKNGAKDEQLQLQLVLQIRSTLKAYSKLNSGAIGLSKPLTPYRRRSDPASHDIELPETRKLGPLFPPKLSGTPRNGTTGV